MTLVACVLKQEEEFLKQQLRLYHECNNFDMKLQFGMKTEEFLELYSEDNKLLLEQIYLHKFLDR